VTPLRSPLRDLRSACLVAGLLAGTVYLNSLPNRFAYDDVQIVTQNTAIHSLETLPGALVAPYWPIEHGRELGLWRPVTTGLLGLQYVIGGGSPLIFHVVNVVGHVLATVLTVLLVAELMPLAGALVAGLVFAVHPVHVEAVANVVGLSEIVSAVALLLACLVHVRSGPVSGWRTSLLIGALYLLGFGAKESGVTLPGLIFLLDAARCRLAPRDLLAYVRDRWRLYMVLVVVAATLLVSRRAILGSMASAYAPLGAQLLEEIPRIWTLGEVWLHYVRLWVFPLDLYADYSPNVIPISSSWAVDNAVGVGLALAILSIALLAWRRPAMSASGLTARAAAFGVLWFVIAISPTSNTVILSGVLLAERVLYLPSVGLAAATGWLAVRLADERPKVAVAFLVLIVLGSAARTWTRNPTWYDSSHLFTRMIGDAPHSGRSQWVIGDQLVRAGRTSQALHSYRAAISLLGTSYHLITEIARNMVDQGYYQGGERLYSFAIRDDPEFPWAYRGMSASRAEQGDAVGTERWSRLALERQRPGADPGRHHLLAWSLAAQGRMAEAAEQRALGEETGGRALFWQGYVYDAYALRSTGALDGAVAKLDTAWIVVRTGAGRRAIDSVRVSEFGLDSRLVEAAEGPSSTPDR
jgi:tetratricopeptide (TPR) repeat protein